MPCHVDTSFEDSQDANHMGRGADILCSFMHELESQNLLHLMSPKALSWFEEHKRRDAAREAGTSYNCEWLSDENAPWRNR
jgi:hypothetical protein